MSAQIALPPHTVHFAPSLALTHLIELAGHIETLRGAIPDYIEQHDAEVVEAMERSESIMKYLANHALMIDDTPAGQQSPPNVGTHQPQALLEVISAMTGASTFLGRPVTITGCTDHGLQFTDAEEDNHVLVPWFHAITLRAGFMGELIAADFAPDRFPPGHARKLWAKAEALRTGDATTGGITEISAVVDEDDQLDQQHADAEAEATRMRQQLAEAAEQREAQRPSGQAGEGA